MRHHILHASALLAGNCHVTAGDYSELLRMATDGDVVYMDPPYQGVGTGKDQRYHQQLDLDRFVGELDLLNGKGVDYLISFDGKCGDKHYGNELPSRLQLAGLMIEAGRSSQSTLSGRSDRTVESLYLSPNIARKFASGTTRMNIDESAEQLSFVFEIAHTS